MPDKFSPLFISNDGSAYLYETMTMVVHTPARVAEASVTEATKPVSKKRLVVQIAAIHEGITKNYTEYPIEELEASIPTWTAPYNKPVVTNHGKAEGIFGRGYPVEDILGRIMKVTSDEHAGTKCLIFTCSITDKDAIVKIGDGRYATVSIGAKVKSAVCSICDNDWAKGKYCEHERGSYYLLDEENPESAKRCTWIIGGLEGIEISFVTVPADSNAMVLSAREEDAVGVTAEASLFYVNPEGIEEIAEDGTSVQIAESVAAGRLLLLVESAEASEIPEKEDDSVSKEEEAPVVESGDEVTEPVVETPAEEPEVTVDDTETDESGADGQEADEAEVISDEVASEEGLEEPQAAAEEEASEEIGEENDTEDNELRDMSAKYHMTLVTLFVERGIADGSLDGEYADLMENYLKTPVEEIEDLLGKQKTEEYNPAEILEVAGIATGATLATGADLEANADEEFAKDLGNSKEKAEVDGVVIEDDEGEKVIIRAKARR
jgi:hypothetical protein